MPKPRSPKRAAFLTFVLLISQSPLHLVLCVGTQGAAAVCAQSAVDCGTEAEGHETGDCLD